jgi:curved DNA-binding protein CbpA
MLASPAALFPFPRVPMTAQNPLELDGDLSAYPLAELLAEIEEAELDGSMRLSRGGSKAMIYFRAGAVVYAASNAREHRLLHILVDLGKIGRDPAATLPKCTNDIEFADALCRGNILPRNVVDDAVIAQIDKIIVDVMSWPEGEFHFSPLVRPRSEFAYDVKVRRICMGYGRVLPAAAVLSRFRNVDERFSRAAAQPADLLLQSHEDRVLACFGDTPRSISEIVEASGLPRNGALQALYALWLGGCVVRNDWNAAFTPARLEAIRHARLSLVRPARVTALAEPKAKPGPPANVEQKPAEAEVSISLEEYLSRVENGLTYYEILDVEETAPRDNIKARYLLLAKLFHPDRFHREGQDTLDRIQLAFSKVQAAYETLKSTDSRDNYNFKIRKELELKKKVREEGVAAQAGARAEQGLDSFEAGLSLLMEGEYDAAVPFLARASHYNPQNALYRAYHGLALSAKAEQLHKAEGEMQAAVKLDPTNAKIRFMLVDFFVDHKMFKRAEGELRRFLALAPGNAEAARRLEQIPN